MKKRLIATILIITIVIIVAGCATQKDLVKSKDTSNLDDKYVTIGKIIGFKENGVDVLTGDIAMHYSVDKNELKNFYLGEYVGVVKLDDNKYKLESYKVDDFSVRYTNMGDKILTVTGEVVNIKDKELVIKVDEKEIVFIGDEQIAITIGATVTIDYLEDKGNGNKKILQVYDESSALDFTIKSISRAKDGTMVLETEDDKGLKNKVYVMGVLNFNHGDLKVGDKITVYPKEIREIYPQEIDTLKIIKQ
ncbi:hypothetical protein PV797_01815 [Clostridiaceae bacterium M8S5]|nr:hypothetical protein PV797_01815 [Clostridiaceae bacterium M8S5]